MIDAALSLAVSMYSNAGVYALLLGSGVSRSSGVPTGWKIVERLIRDLALLKGSACDPDPQTWYRDVFGREATYSEILDEVAKRPAERMQLLRGYFEPTEEERLEGTKLPSLAHRSIAGLVAKKYIRVLVTTNFDRLLELALADVGIPPAIISTGDLAQGALPLAHAPCTIIKVNGDYLDTRLRNTSGELSSYDGATDRLLDKVFDEYGLIVCGWSGEWDVALRAALERCSTRRFTNLDPA
ncbi:MAG: SIR2 family protein [Bryobacteraceae bacterium]